MTIWRGLVVALFVAGCVWSVPASADQAFDVIQLACVSDMQYFSADRGYVEDVTPGQDFRSPLFAVAWTENLEKKPFACEWKSHRIQVQAYRYNGSGPRPKNSPCSWKDSFGYGVQLFLDGKGIGCLEDHGPSASHRTLLTVNADGVSRDGSILVEQCDVDLSPTDTDKKILAAEGNQRCVTTILPKARK